MLKVDRDRDGYTNLEEYLNNLCPAPRWTSVVTRPFTKDRTNFIIATLSAAGRSAGQRCTASIGAC